MKTRLRTRHSEAPTKWLPASAKEAGADGHLAGRLGEENNTADALPAVEESVVDIAGADSFPASDPPCWTLGREAVPRFSSQPARSSGQQSSVR